MTDTGAVARARVLAAIDVDELLAHLASLVRIPSVTGSAAESELQHTLAAQLAELGLDVDHWKLDLDALRADPDYPGTETERTEGYGVAATTGAGVPGLILQGHADVVPVGDASAWADVDPFGGEIRDGWLYGRGASDMKAGVAAITAVARALRRSGVRLAKPLAVHFVVGEEDGGLGALATLRRGHTGEAAVIPEPTDGHLIVANAGALTFELRVPGLAAHGSSRHEGHSAYEAFGPVHDALRVLERRLNADPDPLFAGNPLPYALSIGRIRAGDWSSTVPDLLIAEGRLGVPLDSEPADVRRQFEEVVAAACARDAWLAGHPATVTWPGGQFAPGRLPAGHPLIAQASAAAEAVTGHRPRVCAAPYGSDLRLYTRVGGIPTLHFGPGDIRWAHAIGERVLVEQVVAATRALAVLAVERLVAQP
ncbi:ArgE/DapE family deacylase [Propionicicella superfundia]|uniref:ArgE/DapE family deacylase n=1 Tax=Propionicicella superfundia TaxID=348582 RepID=UPI00041925D3|nr:ArgE/DapE family deacylase [Propionicicella superfundia]